MKQDRNISDIASRQAEALRALVKHEEETRCRELLDQAHRDTAQILREAHRTARARVKRALAQARALERESMERAMAQVENEVRQTQRTLLMALLQEGREQLGPALLERWESPETRQGWITGAIRQARRRLPAGSWSVAHPPEWPTLEWDACVARLGETLPFAPVFQPDPALRAGVRLCREGTCLDASLDGLLARRDENEAMFLALLEGQGL